MEELLLRYATLPMASSSVIQSTLVNETLVKNEKNEKAVKDSKLPFLGAFLKLFVKSSSTGSGRRRPEGEPSAGRCVEGKCQRPVASGTMCDHHKQKKKGYNWNYRQKAKKMKTEERGEPPNPPLPPPGSSVEDGRCIWRCPLDAIEGRQYCEEHLPPGFEDHDIHALGGADNLMRMSQGLR